METSRVSFSVVALNQQEQSDIQQGNKMKEKLEGHSESADLRQG